MTNSQQGTHWTKIAGRDVLLDASGNEIVQPKTPIGAGTSDLSDLQSAAKRAKFDKALKGLSKAGLPSAKSHKR